MAVILAALYVVANGFDLLTTSLGSPDLELNPILAFAWRSFGFGGVVLVKLVSTAYTVCAYLKLLQMSRHIGGIDFHNLVHSTLWGLTVLLTLVVCWNVVMFLRTEP